MVFFLFFLSSSLSLSLSSHFFTQRLKRPSLFDDACLSNRNFTLFQIIIPFFFLPLFIPGIIKICPDAKNIGFVYRNFHPRYNNIYIIISFPPYRISPFRLIDLNFIFIFSSALLPAIIAIVNPEQRKKSDI